tara:strand:+ start:481 stop:870 length:390 start_codon:yes stop_codon:yes gene_type:complete
MQNSKIKLGSNKSFGIVFFIVFLVIGLWPLINQNEIRFWAILISLIFLILGMLNSKMLTPLNKIWFKFGIFLGNFISPIVMGIIFFLVVTPTGIIMRLLRKDLINLKTNNEKTYWFKKNNDNNNMKNQF